MKKQRKNLTQKRLMGYLRYDQDTGNFYRLYSPRRPDLIGAVAGSFSRNTDGTPKRITILVYGHHYAAHRLVWLYVHGLWPKDAIDHINGNPFDNRLSNLRPATAAQNLANSTTRSNKRTSKYKGVYYSQPKRGTGRWVATVRLEVLGRFKTEEEARDAYDKRAREVFGEFARTNEQIHGNL